MQTGDSGDRWNYADRQYLVSVAVSHIVPIQSILDLIRIHTDGRVFEFHRPVGSQILVSILLMVFWLSAALLPIFSFNL